MLLAATRNLTLRSFGQQSASLATSALSATERAKQLAGYAAVDQVFAPLLQERKHCAIGLGSGSTIEYAIKRIAQLQVSNCVFVPTSFQTKHLILQHNLTLASLDQYSTLDLTIDGADEVDPALNCIKGGGACLFQEMLVARASKRFVLVADNRKQSKQLGTMWKRGVPVEVIPMAYGAVQRTLQTLYPDGDIRLRMALPQDKAGPVVTDNGNFVLDCHLQGLSNPADVYKNIKMITGVVEVGLFCNIADIAFFGAENGIIDVWRRG